jgi:quinol-cytochrome oxidoreductase complex cytochrome b subunit
MHTSGLQIIFIAILVLHVFYIKYFGISPKPYQAEEQYQASLERGSTFMGHAKLLGIMSAGMFVVILGLAQFIQPELLHPPKPGMEMTKPAWPFLVFVPLENLIGIRGIPLGMAIVGGYLVLFPIIGLAMRNERKLFLTVYALVAVGLIFWGAMSIVTLVSPVQSHFGSH